MSFPGAFCVHILSRFGLGQEVDVSGYKKVFINVQILVDRLDQMLKFLPLLQKLDSFLREAPHPPHRPSVARPKTPVLLQAP